MKQLNEAKWTNMAAEREQLSQAVSRQHEESRINDINQFLSRGEVHARYNTLPWVKYSTHENTA